MPLATWMSRIFAISHLPSSSCIRHSPKIITLHGPKNTGGNLFFFAKQRLNQQWHGTTPAVGKQTGMHRYAVPAQQTTLILHEHRMGWKKVLVRTQSHLYSLLTVCSSMSSTVVQAGLSLHLCTHVVQRSTTLFELFSSRLGDARGKIQQFPGVCGQLLRDAASAWPRLPHFQVQK